MRLCMRSLFIIIGGLASRAKTRQINGKNQILSRMRSTAKRECKA